MAFEVFTPDGLTFRERIRRLTRGQFVLLMIAGVGGSGLLFFEIGPASERAISAAVYYGQESSQARTARSEESDYKLATLAAAVATFTVAWARFGAPDNQEKSGVSV